MLFGSFSILYGWFAIRDREATVTVNGYDVELTGLAAVLIGIVSSVIGIVLVVFGIFVGWFLEAV